MRSLAEAGFAPELAASGTRLNLYHCPFRELAEQARDVVCSAHLGLLQGALHAEGSDVQATALLPFVEPGLCVATLEARPLQSRPLQSQPLQSRALQSRALQSRALQSRAR